MINCSEKCTHEDNGICTLNSIMSSSSDAKHNCPFFKIRNKNHAVNKYTDKIK